MDPRLHRIPPDLSTIWPRPGCDHVIGQAPITTCSVENDRRLPCRVFFVTGVANRTTGITRDRRLFPDPGVPLQPRYQYFCRARSQEIPSAILFAANNCGKQHLAREMGPASAALLHARHVARETATLSAAHLTKTTQAREAIK